MNRKFGFATFVLTLTLILSACGGNDTTPAAPAGQATTQTDNSNNTVVGDSSSGSVESQVEAARELLAGRPVEGIDPDTGLEINPISPQQGVEYIARGQLVSFNLTPQESPEFVLEAPNGTVYRIYSQPVPDIYFEDGTQLAPHEYARFMLAEATIVLEDSSSPTTVVSSLNLTLLNEDN